MSGESLGIARAITLVGNTDQRGDAWRYRTSEDGEEPDAYPGPIPVEDVRRRLFSWTAVSRPLAVAVPASERDGTHCDAGGRPQRWVEVPGRQAICRSDDPSGAVLGVFAQGYAPHQYGEWLVDGVARLVEGDLGISSAGLARGGAVAWVEVSVPETFATAAGVEFRPNLLATTSFDGSCATTYKRVVTDVLCDNTRVAALAEPGQAAKVRHTRRSELRRIDAREALALVLTAKEQFTAETDVLTTLTVSDREWAAFLDAHEPLTARGGPKVGNALKVAQEKRDVLRELYAKDPRVAPWAGTAHGVIQAVNTYRHHVAAVRGGSRAERNAMATVDGRFEHLDRTTWRTLAGVLGVRPEVVRSGPRG